MIDSHFLSSSDYTTEIILNLFSLTTDINLRKLVKFRSLVLTLGADDSRLDAYVPLIKLRKATVYKLKVVPESLNDEYSVFVRAERKSDLFLGK